MAELDERILISKQIFDDFMGYNNSLINKVFDLTEENLIVEFEFTPKQIAKLNDHFQGEAFEKFALVPKIEYEELVRDQHFLDALEAHGVDNWIGYDDARADAFGELDD